MVHQDVLSALGADQMQKVCDFSDKEKEAAQKEIDEDKLNSIMRPTFPTLPLWQPRTAF